MHIEDWCDEIVTSFALQAMIGAVGTENVRIWCESQPQPTLVVHEDGEGVVHAEDTEHPIEEVAAPSEQEEADAMEVDAEEMETGVAAGEEGDLRHAPQLDTRSLTVAFAQLQSGDPLQAGAALSEVPPGEREGYAKRAVQLLSQLCLVDLPMLAGFVDLFSVWANSTSSAEEATETVSEPSGEGEGDGANEVPVEGIDSAAAANKTSKHPKSIQKRVSVCCLMLSVAPFCII